MQFFIPALNAGEISDLLAGRTDFKNKSLGGSLVENFIPLVQGPIISRPGTRYISSVYDSTKKTHIFGIKTSRSVSYVVEMSQYVFRFYTSGALIQGSNKTISSATAANPGVFTSNAHGFLKNDIVRVSGATGLWTSLNSDYVVKAVTTNTFQLSSISGDTETDTGTFNSTGFGALTGTVVAKFIGKQHDISETNMYDSNGRFNTGISTLGDSIFFANKSYWPFKLTNASDTSWTYSKHYHDVETVSSTNYYYFRDGPYCPSKPVETKLDFGATGQFVTDGTTGTITSNASLFASTDVGRLVRNSPPTQAGYYVIRSYSSGTSVGARCLKDNRGGVNTSNWDIGLFSATTSYPARVSFHQDRLVYMNVTGYPTICSFSDSSKYAYFQETPFDDIENVDDTNAITLQLANDNTGQIYWGMPAGSSFLIGTEGNIFSVSGSDAGILTPGNAVSKTASSYGSENVMPVIIGGEVIYAEKHGLRLRASQYSSISDGVESIDLNKACPHIFYSDGTSGIKEMAWASNPFNTLWIVKMDGEIISLTYNKDDQISAFARHTLGGSFSGGDAVAESVTTISSTNFTDETWFIVKRTINGSTVRYVERFDNSIFIDPTISQEEALTMDCAYTYNSTPATTITGLSHLEGQAVDVVADGVIIQGKTVSSGQITLTTAASIVNVGLSFRPKFQSTNLDVMSQDGATTGLVKRINSVDIGLYNALGMKVGRDSSNLNEVDFGDYTASKIDLFTGVKKVDINTLHTETPAIRIEQLIPAPICITFLNANGEAYG